MFTSLQSALQSNDLEKFLPNLHVRIQQNVLLDYTFRDIQFFKSVTSIKYFTDYNIVV